MEKSVSNKEKHVWNKTHVWKKVSLITKNMFGIKAFFKMSLIKNTCLVFGTGEYMPFTLIRIESKKTYLNEG